MSGKFLKGHKPLFRPRPAIKDAEPHPLITGLDKYGRYKSKKGPMQAKALKEAMLLAVTPAQVKELMQEMYRLAMSPDTPVREKINAAVVYLDRSVGKPTQAVEVSSEKVTTTTHHHVNYDLTKLSQDELRLLLELQGKANPEQLESRVIDTTQEDNA